MLMVDVTSFIVASRCLKTKEVGIFMLWAMEYASSGRLPYHAPELRRIARMRTNARLPDEYSILRLFDIDGDELTPKPDIFKVSSRGSNKRQALPASIRKFIHERDEYRCVYCGKDEAPFQIDHIMPVSRGGGDEIENLCLACPDCNLSKRDKTVEEWLS